jgi:hypothetical protein
MLERRLSKREKKLLAMLIVIAIVISITGTFLSFDMLNELEVYRQYFTGHGLSGQVNITITENLTINVIQTNITFGTGYVDTGLLGATLNTSVADYLIGPQNWTNTTVYNPKPIELRNDGNVNASINITSGQTADQFLGGTTPSYEFNSSNMLEAGLEDCVGTLYDYTNLDTTQQQFCTNLGSVDNRDQLYAHCRLWVPSDTTGEKEDYWTFTAVSVT